VRARIPGLGTLSLTASPDYRRLWIWSMKDRNFVCIEPAMNHYDGLADTPVIVAPGKALESWLSIGFEPEA
jgi:galactose mutarotase-like enzyme